MDFGIGSNNKKTILAIDDVSLNLTIIKNILSGDYDLRVAKSGKMALSILSRLKADLILLDIEMPVMSGFEFLEIMRNDPELRDIPVICVTSHAENDVAEQGAKLGVLGFLSRPVDSAVLKAKVSDALKT